MIFSHTRLYKCVVLLVLVAGFSTVVRADDDPLEAQEALGLKLLNDGRADEGRAALRSAAEGGRASAQFALGELSEADAARSTGDERNDAYANAAYWYHKASDQNYPPAMNNFGALYYDGRGVERDPTQALSLYKKAADAGNAQGQYNLALLILQDKAPGTKQDAAALIHAASDQEFVNAQAQWARLELEGDLVPANPADAARLFRIAAQKGHAWSQFYFAMMLKSGNGMPRDLTEAYRWMRMAAAQNIAPALYQVGVMLNLGLGVPSNEGLAREAWRRAAALGDTEAIAQLAKLPTLPASGGPAQK